MSGLTARVQLVSNALILLGDKPIASLTEDTTGALLGANLFENTYLTMLQDHRWRFAVKQQLLAKLSIKPITKYNYAFQLPADYLYGFKGSERQFEIYGNEVHANSPTFTMDYIQRIQEDLLPAYFAKALEYNLSAQFAVPITGDEKKGLYYQKIFMDSIRKAKVIDSQQYPEVPVQDSPYTQIRF